MHCSARLASALALVALNGACSGSHAVFIDAGLDGGIDAETDAETDAGTPPVLHLPECDGQPECAVVVRLDYTTLTPLGWRAVGGPYQWALDSDMVARATELVALPRAAGAPAHPILEPPLVRAHAAAFEVSPLDFGGMAIFHSTTGALLFAGTTVWAGRGEILAIFEWHPASDLRPQRDGGGGSATGRGEMGPLTETAAAAIARPARETNLGVALTRWNGPGAIAAHLFFYARSVGTLDPSTAEWIVVLTPERPSAPSLAPGAPCDPDHCGGCCAGGTCRRGDEPAWCGALGSACIACSGPSSWCVWQTAPASCDSLPP